MKPSTPFPLLLPLLLLITMTIMTQQASCNPHTQTPPAKEGGKIISEAADAAEKKEESTRVQGKSEREKEITRHYRALSKTFTCSLCKSGVYYFTAITGKSPSRTNIIHSAITVCELFKIQGDRVCEGIVNMFADEFFAILQQIGKPSQVCGMLFGPTCEDEGDPFSNWEVPLPTTPQPTPAYPTPPKAGSPTMRFLHLSDIHIDYKYKVGSITSCGEPLCCREGSAKGARGAGKFGDYRDCDIPLWTVENMFQHLADRNDTFDYIIWTGDLPAHDVWDQPRGSVLSDLERLTALFLKYFPDKPIYPALGNHESSPVNSFPPAYIKGNNSIDWLYDALAKNWAHWLPEEAQESIKWGGYYTMSPYPGFRIISLNMNYCNNQNFWLLINQTDPNGELQWLMNTLQTAEDKGEKVHILGHIPPGNGGCMKSWSWNYYKIISRYQNTISGQFFGHNHPDLFQMFYDVDDMKRPVSVAYLGPSVTTFSDMNPAYRMYEADGMYNGSSYQVLDHETYIMNVSRANEEGHITWEFEYSAKEAYNMSSLYPKDWDQFIYRISHDQDLLKLYNKYYHKSRDDGTCDASCQSWRPCQARTGRSYDPSLCLGLADLGKRDVHEMTLKNEPKYC